jgi:hypothetical protein
MIQQLDIMESELKKYIEVDNYETGTAKSNEHIYSTASEITNIVDNVQKELDDISSKVMHNTQKNNENLTSITYENVKLKENINIDVNFN